MTNAELAARLRELSEKIQSHFTDTAQMEKDLREAAAALEAQEGYVKVPKEATVQWSGRLRAKCGEKYGSHYEMQAMINDVLSAAPKGGERG